MGKTNTMWNLVKGTVAEGKTDAHEIWSNKQGRVPRFHRRNL